MAPATQASLLEACAFAVAERAMGGSTVLGHNLLELAHTLDAAGWEDLARDVRKMTELNRLVAARVGGVLRSLELGGVR